MVCGDSLRTLKVRGYRIIRLAAIFDGETALPQTKSQEETFPEFLKCAMSEIRVCS